jgi:hypothetical protein
VVSLDGGRTFISAPSAGLPQGGNLFGPFATLADGSIVYGEYGPQAARGPSALYSWKKGQSAWTDLKISVPAGVAAVSTATTNAATTTQAITIIDNNGQVTTASVTLQP